MRYTGKYTNIRKIIAVTASVIAILLWNIFSGLPNVRAEELNEAVNLVERFEQTDVLDDLTQSIVAGNKFNLSDYPHDEDGNCSVLSFIEFGYSLYSDNQADYGLYVYIYNPSDIGIDKTDRNMIQFKCGKETSKKLSLDILNYSKKTGFEGRFYKFKVRISGSDKADILSDIGRNGRVYAVTEIELCHKTEVKSYKCAQTYTYTGYAKGYGSELTETDTLSCSVDGFDTYVEFNVKHTEYRAKGDYYYGEQSQLNSVYFRIPNKFFESYGNLSEIECEWWEYFTKPMLVVNNSKVYNDINALHGGPFHKGLTNRSLYYVFLINWQVNSNWFGGGKALCTYGSNMNLNGQKYTYTYWNQPRTYTFSAPPFESFAAAFYSADLKNIDVSLDSNAVITKLKENSKYFDESLFDLTEEQLEQKHVREIVRDRYRRYLFEDYVQNGYDLGYNYKKITPETKFEVWWNKTKLKDFWAKYVTGEFTVETEYEKLNAIITLGEDDVKGTDDEVSSKLYVNKRDVPDLKNEMALAKANDETLVLFRFSSTKYFAAPGVWGYSSNPKTPARDIVEICSDKEHDGIQDCYAVQQTVYLDYDIISMTYTNNGVNTAIPVVMSPVDITGGITPPLEYNRGDSESTFFKILKIVLIVIVGLLVVWLLSKFGLTEPIGKGIVAIGKGLWWLICAPFRGIKALIAKRKGGA